MNMTKSLLVLSIVGLSSGSAFVGCAGNGGANTVDTSIPSTGGSTGGAGPGTGGVGGVTPSSDNVTFKNGQAQGEMTGWGWVALGLDDSLTSPTCDTGIPISKTAACTTTTQWNKPDALCMSGVIPALPQTPTQADYDNNWGLQIGLNAKEPNDSIGKAFSSVSVTVSGVPAGKELRVMLHRKGDADGNTFCAAWEGKTLKVSDFRTACWGPTGTAFDPAETASVDKIMIQVPSVSMAEIKITDLCWQGLTLK